MEAVRARGGDAQPHFPCGHLVYAGIACDLGDRRSSRPLGPPPNQAGNGPHGFWTPCYVRTMPLLRSTPPFRPSSGPVRDLKEATARRRALRMAASAAVAGCAVLIPTVATAASEDVPPEGIGAPTLQFEPSPVHGTVLDQNGSPAADADVVLIVWPTDAELAALTPGDPVAVQRVGLTQTDKHGRYSLVPDYETLSASLGGRPGARNVEVVASTADSVAPYSTTMYFDPAAKTIYQVSGGPSATLASGSATTAEPIDLQLQTADATSIGAVAEAETPTVAAAPTVPCMTYQADYGPRWVRVGQLYSTATSGFSASFAYSTSATSSLGVGYSLTGAYGSFSQSGTTSNSSTASVGFGALNTSGGRGYSTQFRYGRYYGTGCSPSNVFYYQARSTGFVSGASTASLTVPSAGYCTSYGAGSSFTKSTTNAVTWSDGVNITSVIGVNLSAKTGYSTTAKASFSFSSARRLCGTSDYPGGSPSRFVVK